MNLLVTGAWQGAKENIEKIEQMGHMVSFLQFEKEELPCAYEWVEGAICNGLFLKHPIEKFVNLRYIQLTSAGFDRVPIEYVKEHGIAIHNARGVYSIPMAEFAVWGVLELYKKAAFFKDNQKAHRWEKHRGLLELYGKTVCIVGSGSVGTECAKRFRAFGCDVIGVDLFPREDENYRKMIAMGNLTSILPLADILILTLPLTSETKYLMNAEKLSLMKKKAIIVNIARGAVVDSHALENALDKQLGGAVLDVFESEPLDENSSLWDKENVIITPHNSFVGERNNIRLSDLILQGVEAYR